MKTVCMHRTAFRPVHHYLAVHQKFNTEFQLQFPILISLHARAPRKDISTFKRIETLKSSSNCKYFGAILRFINCNNKCNNNNNNNINNYNNTNNNNNKYENNNENNFRNIKEQE